MTPIPGTGNPDFRAGTLCALFFYKAGDRHLSAITITVAATTTMMSSPLYQRILKSRDSSFKGSSILNISSFRPPVKYHREFNRWNVERLKRIFRQEGPQRCNHENRIPVLLSKEEFMGALRLSNLRESDLTTHKLEEMRVLEAPKHSIRYLHGHHRLAAAKEFLAPSEQWWGVDIYLETGM